MKELPKVYDPRDVESRIYKMWMDGNCFRAEIDPDKKPFSIVMPPPNVTGQLHMGAGGEAGEHRPPHVPRRAHRQRPKAGHLDQIQQAVTT